MTRSGVLKIDCFGEKTSNVHIERMVYGLWFIYMSSLGQYPRYIKYNIQDIWHCILISFLPPSLFTYTVCRSKLLFFLVHILVGYCLRAHQRRCWWVTLTGIGGGVGLGLERQYKGSITFDFWYHPACIVNPLLRVRWIVSHGFPTQIPIVITPVSRVSYLFWPCEMTWLQKKWNNSANT